MKYMMIVYYDPAIEEVDDDNDINSWVGEMDGRGVRLEGEALSPEDATRSGCGAARCWSRTGRRRDEEIMSGTTSLTARTSTRRSRWRPSTRSLSGAAMELRPFPAD